MSIITAIIFAFVMTPLYNKLSKKIKSRNLNATIITVILIIIITIPAIFLTPVLLKQSIAIFLESQKINLIKPLQDIFPSLFMSDVFASEIASIIHSFITKITNGTMNMITNFIFNFPTLFLQSLVMLFTFFFVLRDNDKFVSYIQSILPFPKKTEEKLFKSSKDITFSVLYGQIIIGIMQGLFAGVSFFIFGVENALFLTVLACIMGIFPIIGTSIVWIPVAIYLFVEGQFWPAIGVISFGTIASIVENGVKPMIIAKRTNVNSAIILLGMIGGVFLFGALGFILGPLILSYLLIILEIYRDKRLPGVFIKHPEDEEQDLDIKMDFF
jgi:predicted PurR-regulated permease PerM